MLITYNVISFLHLYKYLTAVSTGHQVSADRVDMHSTY